MTLLSLYHPYGIPETLTMVKEPPFYYMIRFTFVGRYTKIIFQPLVISV